MFALRIVNSLASSLWLVIRPPPPGSCHSAAAISPASAAPTARMPINSALTPAASDFARPCHVKGVVHPAEGHLQASTYTVSRRSLMGFWLVPPQIQERTGLEATPIAAEGEQPAASR